MRRLTTAVCMAVLFGATAAAQTMPMGKMQKDKMATKTMGEAITVTGCVAAGTEADQFTLTGAVKAGETAGQSYDLVDGDVKAHLGHKVAVTGTLEGKMADKDKMGPKPMMEKEHQGEHAMPATPMAGAPHSALHVASVKMIAAACE